MEKFVHSDPEIMGGTPVFVGTRIPVSLFFDWLADGQSVDEFLSVYDWVKREQVMAVLQWANSFLQVAINPKYEVAA
jgi:uncharacterized protein (DUF433 family)